MWFGNRKERAEGKGGRQLELYPIPPGVLWVSRGQRGDEDLKTQATILLKPPFT